MDVDKAETEMKEVEMERIYQTELLDMAKKKNVIICLPTGAGKTFIALQLAKYYLAECIRDRKFIIFMATTVHLVYQQSKYFKDHIPSSKHGRIKTITGEDNVDVWGPYDWIDLLKDCTILFLTPQIVLDALNHNYMELERIKLLILDECHNAGKEHPMSGIMRLYKEKFDKFDENEREKLPRILGLTATIIKGKPKGNSIEKEIANIEDRLKSKCITYHKYEEVLKHSTSAQNNIQIEVYENKSNDLWNDEEILKPLTDAHDFLTKIKHKFPRAGEKSINNEAFVNEGQRYSNKPKFLVNESISILNELIEVYHDMGPYPARLGGLIRRFYIMSKGIKTVCKKDPGDYFISLVDTAIASFISRIDVLLSTKPDHERIQVFVSNKIKILIRRLSEFRDKELCGLVFTTKRITAQILSWFFKDAANKCGDMFSFIKPGFIIGASRDTRDPTEVRTTTKKQEKIIYGFHRGDYNILFATSVLEEGLNVPICNVVIRYDEISNYPSYVQSMGRARKAGACFIVLVDQKKPDKKNLEQFKEYNVLLSNYLVEHAVHLDNDDKYEESDVKEEERFAEIYKKYIFNPGPDIPRITLNSSIRIVNTFCNTLSISNLSVPSPLAFWEKDNETSKFRAHIQLPLNSVIRDFVTGDWIENKSLAKKVANLKVCELLYKEGVLDERLMPRKKPMPKHIQDFIETNDKLLDGKENKTWIPKRIPNCFKMFPFKSGQRYNAIKIDINLTDSRFEDSEIAQLYNFEEKKYSFSIISQFPIDIDSFVLNARFGDLKVKFEKIEIMEESRSKLSFSDQKLDVLHIFHDFIFTKLLKIEHKVFDKINNPYMLLAPIYEVAGGGYEIYWKLAEDLIYYSQIMDEPKDEDRKNWEFDKELYDDAVVGAWYRKSVEMVPEIFVVLNVINDENALSKFEDKKFNFATYFKNKYFVDTFHPQDNLLKCKKIGKNLNFLSVKHTSSLSKEERKDINDGKSIAKLIPELTNLFPMPGSLYMQTFFLPSIIHRISRLLISQDIQQSVANEFNWVSAKENGHKRKFVDTDVPNKKLKLLIQEPEKGIREQIREPSPADIDDITHVEFIEHSDLLTMHLLNSMIEKKRKRRNQDNLDPMEINIDQERHSPDLQDIIARYCDGDDKIELPDLDFQPDFTKESGPDLFTILEAITLTNSQDSIDMEKLETLGDSFLKYIVSVNLFVHHSNWEEGVMTQCRSSVISNNNLYRLGKVKFLDQIIAGSIFHPDKTWLPPSTEVRSRYSELVTEGDVNYDVFSNHSKEHLESASRVVLRNEISSFSKTGVKRNSPSNVTYTHARLKSKNVADCAEALIGAYYKNGGICSALRFMTWLGIQIPISKEGVRIYLSHPLHFPEELTTDNSIRKTKLEPEDYVPYLSELEETLQYKFKNKWLAVEALTHPCYIGTERNTGSYQRLEYLGDAALDFLITQHIFDFEVCKTPGDLTDLRSALVNNVTFASLAVRYGFHKYLLMSDKKVHDTIDLFQNYQKQNGHKVTGHFTMMNDLETVVVQEIEVPKCLGDVFESIAGAIFVDSGFSLNVLWKVIYRLMKHEIDFFGTKIPKAPIRMIYELFTNVKFSKIEYDGGNNIARNPNLTYIEMTVNGVMFIGCGDNKKSSKQAACKFALKYFSLDKNKNLLRV